MFRREDVDSGEGKGGLCAMAVVEFVTTVGWLGLRLCLGLGLRLRPCVLHLR